MKLYLDTEFNGFCSNNLISMGIVSADGREFYEIKDWPIRPHPWVKDNVLPVLGDKTPVRQNFSHQLWRFLTQFSGGIHVIADWPEDLMYFHQALVIGESCYRVPPLTTELWTGAKLHKSAEEHNALADARALKLNYEDATKL